MAASALHIINLAGSAAQTVLASAFEVHCRLVVHKQNPPTPIYRYAATTVLLQHKNTTTNKAPAFLSIHPTGWPSKGPPDGPTHGTTQPINPTPVYGICDIDESRNPKTNRPSHAANRHAKPTHKRHDDTAKRHPQSHHRRKPSTQKREQ